MSHVVKNKSLLKKADFCQRWIAADFNHKPTIMTLYPAKADMELVDRKIKRADRMCVKISGGISYVDFRLGIGDASEDYCSFCI